MAKQLKANVVNSPATTAAKAVGKASSKATKTVAASLPKGKAKQASTAPAVAPVATAPAAAPVVPTTPAVVAKGQHGVLRSKDLPWCAKKAALFAGLVALNATTAGTAQSSRALALQCGLTDRDVRHYAYHAQAAGLTGVHQLPNVRGYGFSITPAGIAMLANPPVVATPTVAPVAAVAPVVAPVAPQLPKASKGKGKKS